MTGVESAVAGSCGALVAVATGAGLATVAVGFATGALAGAGGAPEPSEGTASTVAASTPRDTAPSARRLR
nr:MAG: hypothetical protein DIU78_16330 [Pseudomonadota bacterium]